MIAFGAYQGVVWVDRGLCAIPGVEGTLVSRAGVEVSQLAFGRSEEVFRIVIKKTALVGTNSVAVERQAVAVANVLARDQTDADR
jgi:RNA polymerase-interacting CarD/CdnL/TRCF family regulator